MSGQTTKHLSWLNLEIWCATRLLPFSILYRNFSEMLAYAEANKNSRYDGIRPDQIAAAVFKATRRPWVMRNRRCLRQGLIGYRYLRKAGYRPELHFGIDPGSLNEKQINAHCWVVLDGKPLINDRLNGMSTIHVHQSESTLPLA